MATKLAQAGYYKLHYIRIQPLFPDKKATGRKSNQPDYIDVTKTLVNWNIDESMNAPFVSGFVILNESNNLLEDVPLRGEELITISWTDFYGTTHTKTYFIYSVDNIKPGSSINDRMVQYTLRFTSNQKLISDTKEIRRSFGKQKISQMVEQVYNEYFLTGNEDLDKEIEIEETDGEQTLVIPCLYPDAAMQFLSRRAYSASNKTSLYRFFETREKYYFCTHEYLIDKYGSFEDISAKKKNQLFFIYSTLNDNTGSGQLKAQQSINDVQYGTKVDSFSDMKDGSYRRVVTELDIQYRTRTSRMYDYTSEYESFKAPETTKLTHSDEFVNTYMANDVAPETVLLTDFPQIGMERGDESLNMLKPYQHFYENYTTKPIVDYHMNRNTFAIEINGRTDLYPGMIINLDPYKFSNTLSGVKESDTQRSGNYLVVSISNNFVGDEFKQTLAVTRGGLS